MFKFMKKTITILAISTLAFALTGCGSVGGKRIVRISHSQSQEHPDHLGLLAFEKYVESRLGDKYDVQIFPNELLGPSVKTIELTQTGAIDYVLTSTGNVETFDNIYQIFSLPYLFDNADAYHAVMEDKELINSIYESTKKSGFQGVTWFDAGSRNFYTKTPIRTPEDLKGKKIRVIQSPVNVRMMQLFGAAATPMSFGEVYTAIQQGVIDGAENNELALTNNKHGEVAKHYVYNQHQMVPDILVANVKFLEGLSPEDRKVFDEAAKEATRVERENWDKQVQEAIKQAKAMGVKFTETDIKPFKEKVMPLHKELLSKNKKLRPIYAKIQGVNKKFQVKGGK